MKSILMSTVSFTMSHINGTASVAVPVWFMLLYSAASLVWPIVAILALLR
jgi:hypothetical protein